MTAALSRRLRSVCFGSLSLLSAGCGISGDVLSMYGQRVPEITGSNVYAVPATTRTGALLGKACRQQREDFDRYRSEVARLIGSRFPTTWTAQPMSARSANPANSVLRGAIVDSVRSIPRPSQIAVDSLAVTLSVKATVVGSSGHFTFASLHRGAYYLVMPGVGWWGVDGKQWPVRVTIRMDDMRDGCSAVG